MCRTIVEGHCIAFYLLDEVEGAEQSAQASNSGCAPGTQPQFRSESKHRAYPTADARLFLITARLCELQGPAGFRRSWTEGSVAGLNFVWLILRGVFSVAAGVVFGRQDAGEGSNGCVALPGFSCADCIYGHSIATSARLISTPEQRALNSPGFCKR